MFRLVVFHTRCSCARFKPLWAVRGGQGPSCLYFLSRVTGWARVEMVTFSDIFVSLVEFVCSGWMYSVVEGPCASFKPMWSVRGCQEPTCYHFMEPSHRMDEGPRWARFLTFFASLVEFVCSGWLCEILEVRVHLLGPCGRSGDVRGRRSITF